MKSDDDILIDTISNKLFERIGASSIFTLPWVSQVVLVVVGTQGIIDNGGLIFFFERDWDDQPPYSVFANAYRAIGSEECADCMDVAASLFPSSDPHLHCELRREYMRKNCRLDGGTDESSILVKLGYRIMDHSASNYSLVAGYIRCHLDEISS